MATAIGVVGSAITIFNFLTSQLPSSDQGGNSNLRFAIGLDGTTSVEGSKPLINAGGDLPDIRLWNENGKFLGAEYDPGTGKSGTTNNDVTVRHDEDGANGQQATYALFSGNTDAICIAYIAITWPDDQKFTWVGNWAKTCDAEWYYSNIFLDGYRPNCIWVDGNGDKKTTAFQIHFPDYADGNDNRSEDQASDDICDTFSFNTRQDKDPNSVRFNSGRASPNDKKRSQLERNSRSRQSPNENRLIISSQESHSARELCGDPYSYGPDLVSKVEGMFCNMRDGLLMPLCSDQVTVDCFDLETEAQVSKRSIMKREEPYVVIDWN